MGWSDGEGPWGQNDSQRKDRSGDRFRGFPAGSDELVRWLRRNMKFFMRPGWAGWSVFFLIFLAAFALWAASGFYRVNPNEQGVILRFGRNVRIAQPGLNYHLPYPIEGVIIKDVTAVNRIDSGHSLQGRDDMAPASLMLTGDENIVHVHFTVLWMIKSIEDYLFNAKSPDATVKSAAESVVREIVAQTPIAVALTEGRSAMSHKAQTQLQSLLDEYKLGIHIQEVLLGRIDPPLPTLDSYRDVQRAKADSERLRHNSESYRNSQIPLARGRAQTVIQGATGVSRRNVAVAKGNAERFETVLTQYLKSPGLFSYRLYLETMEDILKDANKTIVPGGAQEGVLPYLPLSLLGKTPKQPAPSARSSLNTNPEIGGHIP